MDNEITAPSDIMDVKSKMIIVRGQVAMLDRDVAALYGVETKHVNQAVKNNPGRFPDGYTFALDKEEVDSLRSKILTLENSEGRGKYSKHGYKVFTERGLYMLATVHKKRRECEGDCPQEKKSDNGVCPHSVVPIVFGDKWMKMVRRVQKRGWARGLSPGSEGKVKGTVPTGY